MTEEIKVWRFEDAPDILQALSRPGGDEDWVAVIPPEYVDMYIPWLECPHFGCCDVKEYDHPLAPGYKVRIGQHA